MKNNNTIRTRKGSVLDGMRLEPWELPNDMPLDFNTLNKSELVELYNCIDILMSLKQHRYRELDDFQIEEIRAHKKYLLSKACQAPKNRSTF